MRRAAERGAALFVTFLLMLVISALAFGVGILSFNSVQTGKSQLLDKQALYVAEAGWQRARQAMAAGTWTPSSAGTTYTESFGSGEYAVTLTHNSDNTYTISSAGYVPSQAAAASRRRVVETGLTVGAGGENLSLDNATASASSTNGSQSASKAIDDDTGTYWEAGTTGSNQWLRLDFDDATSLSYLVLTENNNNIDALTVEYSSDGSSWTTAPALSAIESPSKTWHMAFTATSARYFQAKFTSVSSGQRASVKEFEAYASSTFNTPLTYSTQW